MNDPPGQWTQFLSAISANPLGNWEQVQILDNQVYRTADFLESAGWAFGRQHIARWDGQVWINYPLPDGYTGNVIAVRILSQDDAWAAEKHGLLRWNGDKWQPIPIQMERDEFLFGLDFVSPKQGWAVGAKGSGPFSGIAFQWDGNTWIRTSLPDTSGLSAIDMISAVDGWVAEGNNRMLRWNGKEWRIYRETNIQGYVSSIDMVDSNDGWMVGSNAEQGVIWHWDGAKWYEFQRARLELESIAMVSSDFGWAVGGDWRKGGSLLLNWNGNAWIEHPISTDNPLRFVWAISTDDGWIFAGDEDIPPFDKGAVFRYRLAPAATPTLPPTPSAISTATTTPTPTVAASPTPTSELITVSEQPANNASKVSMWLLIAAAFGLLVIVAVLFLRRWRKV